MNGRWAAFCWVGFILWRTFVKDENFWLIWMRLNHEVLWIQSSDGETFDVVWDTRETLYPTSIIGSYIWRVVKPLVNSFFATRVWISLERVCAWNGIVPHVGLFFLKRARFDLQSSIYFSFENRGLYSRLNATSQMKRLIIRKSRAWFPQLINFQGPNGPQ